MYQWGPIFTPGKDGALVKSEAIHMRFLYPVSQALDDQLLGDGMVAIECVAAAGVVHVILPRRWNKEVITAIIDTSETKRWSLMVAFIGVIEDYIKDYLDTRFVKRFYRIAELLEMHPIFWSDAVRGLRGKIAHRAVAPEIPERLAVDYSHGYGFVKIKNW